MTTIATRTQFLVIEERMEHRDYRAALDLIDEVRSGAPTSGEDDLWLDVMRGECLAFLGQYHEAISLSQKAASVLRRGGDHALFARACFAMAVAQLILGELDTATENANLALYSSKRVDDHAGVVRAANKLANIVSDKGDLEHALTSYDECISTAREHGIYRWSAVAGDNKARLYLLMGRLREARAAFRGNRRILIDLGENLNVARHDLSRAWLEVNDRRFPRAEAILRRVARESRDSLPARERGIWYEYTGELEYSRGRLKEAETHLLRAIAIGNESGPDESLIGQSRRILADVRLAQGDIAEAEAECQRALSSIRKVGERFEEGAVNRVLGTIHSARGETEAARQAFRTAADIHAKIGARLEWAKTCLAAGRCAILGERGRLGYLFEAERLFAEIGVAYWIDETRGVLQGILTERSPRGTRTISDAEPEAEAPVIITQHAETLNTLRMAECYAQDDLAILITGETGTGKDLLARYVRWMSPRRFRPFVTIDLNTIPESLWESELFGHRKGTFTGAAGEKAGLLETADGGTVFLNEIGNLPMSLQAKLLEFLDTHEVRRLGDARPKTLDVRLIAATNSDLRSEVESGVFRRDLYYRLEEAPLHLLPLRHRREDIPLLMKYFLEQAEVSAPLLQSLPTQEWVKQALDVPWDGNVRELRHFIQQVTSLAGRQSAVRDFASWAERLIGFKQRNGGNGNGNGDREAAQERMKLLDALTRHNWNQRAVARELQMSEGGVRHMMRRYQIERPAGACDDFGNIASGHV